MNKDKCERFKKERKPKMKEVFLKGQSNIKFNIGLSL